MALVLKHIRAIIATLISTRCMKVATSQGIARRQLEKLII